MARCGCGAPPGEGRCRAEAPRRTPVVLSRAMGRADLAQERQVGGGRTRKPQDNAPLILSPLAHLAQAGAAQLPHATSTHLTGNEPADSPATATLAPHTSAPLPGWGASACPSGWRRAKSRSRPAGWRTARQSASSQDGEEGASWVRALPSPAHALLSEPYRTKAGGAPGRQALPVSASPALCVNRLATVSYIRTPP